MKIFIFGTGYVGLKKVLGKRTIRNQLPLRLGGVPDTFSDITELARATGFAPAMAVCREAGRFVAWYRNYGVPLARGVTP